jgi:2-polyprenyl-6-methoxyphenol hydroxylase-like FAD-dependent oxidoreductase
LLLGDSAFVARPHVGAGITKAALDAQALADALTQERDLSAALTRYDRERRAYGGALIARARYLGGYLEASAKRNGVVPERTPETVLAEYGAAGKLG